MNKPRTILLLISMLLMFFVGCTSNNQTTIKPQQAYISPHSANVNDVDISDLDVNLSETETMLTEEISQSTKLKRNPFPVSEYYALPRTGKGTIEGTIYLTDGYGSQTIGTNTRLYLNPVTSYSKQWYEEGYLGGQKMESADNRLYNYLQFTSSNSNGRFAFYGVPNGSYYLIGMVKCGQRCGFANTKNIRLATKVSIQGNQIIQRNLTRDMR